MIRYARFVVAVCCLGRVLVPHAVAQGPLAPSTGPAPSMKTLLEVEPRTPISSLPFSITNSGSYYLTANLTGSAGLDGITLVANDVDLDLNGFVLSGVPGSGNGIASLGSQINLRIHNGTVRQWTGSGINAAGYANGQFENLRVSENVGQGLASGPNSTIRNCVAQLNGDAGINAGGLNVVSGCAAYRNLTYGISALQGSLVSDCTAGANTNSGFIANGQGCTIRRCVSRQNGGTGIISHNGTTVNDCTVQQNSGDGIAAPSNGTIARNTCNGNGAGAGSGAGIFVTGDDNRIEDNHLTGNDRGLDLDGTKKFVAGNTVQNNADNYDIVSGNRLNLLLCQIPESIDWPAAVTLAGSLTGVAGTNGITINADDITLDLGGHELVGAAGSSNGIVIAGPIRHNITVQNGTIRNWGQDGVNLDSTRGTRMTGLRAYTNGWSSTLKAGLRPGSAAHVRDCVAEANQSDGIFTGESCTLTACVVYRNGRYGMRTLGGCTISQCSANGNGSAGIVAGDGSRIDNCIAQFNSDGIFVYDNCLVSECTSDNNSSSGIETGGNRNRFEGNHVSNNQTGFSVGGGANFIVRNTAAGNTTGFSVGVGNKAAQVIVPGAAFVSTDPWANFAY